MVSLTRLIFKCEIPMNQQFFSKEADLSVNILGFTDHVISVTATYNSAIVS